MHQMHNSILAGHLGQKKTKEKDLRDFIGMESGEDVNLLVLKCEICGTNKFPAINL